MILRCQCLTWILFLSLLHQYGTVINRNFFIRKPLFDGQVCNPNTLQIFGHRDSKLSCSKACAGDALCSSFFYNTVDKSCRGSKHVYMSSALCSENVGNIYYVEGTVDLPRKYDFLENMIFTNYVKYAYPVPVIDVATVFYSEQKPVTKTLSTIPKYGTIN